MELETIRKEINSIDEQIIKLFTQRMNCSREVARFKAENGMQVFDPAREALILDKTAEMAGEYGDSARLLYATIMELSRAVQHDMLGSGEELRNRILTADTETGFNSANVRVACFGAPGAYAHSAAARVFPGAQPMFYSPFKEVFMAVGDGEADFGVIPIENSSAGSVTEVYDLMLRYRFYISAAVDIPVDHCLAAAKGTKVTDIIRVYSHSQALSQCSDFLNAHPAIEAHDYVSTAQAAEYVAASGKPGYAAICSEDAARKSGLEIIQRGFQNNPNNTTRFIVISKKLFITPDADKISLCFSLPHRTGSLYSTLCRFAAHGLNLTKIESRPIFGKSFEYLFYLDFTGSVRRRETLSLLCTLSDELTEFSFLGNYREL